MLNYRCKIWMDSFNDDPKQEKLKPIIPVVFYQGKGKWEHSTQFLDLIEHKDFDTDFLPQARHFLIDQSDFGLEDFHGEIKARIVQLLLKMNFHGPEQDALRLLARWLDQIEASGGLDFTKIFINYLLHIEDVIPQEIHKIIVEESRSSTLGETIMTGAERLRLEGREEGEKIGLEKGLEKGDLIGEIRTLQRVLKQPQSSKEELFGKTIETLSALREELDAQLNL